jgi:hypothetical protein
MPRRLSPIAEGPTMAGACKGYSVAECEPDHGDFCYWKASTNKCTSRPMHTFQGKRPQSAKQRANAAAKKGVQPAGLAKYQAELAKLKAGGMTHQDAQAALRAAKQRGGYWY